MVTLWQDVKYGIRGLVKSPGFALVAIATLALGIGANTAIFSVIYQVLLRPLPFPQSERLVAVQTVDTVRGVPFTSASYPDFFDWRRENRVFSGIAAYHDTDLTLTGVPQPEHLSGEIVSSGFFETLGIGPQIGRSFLPAEETAGQEAAILSYRLWEKEFHADPSILAHTITLNGHSYSIIGVMPRGFNFPITAPPVELWVSAAADAEGKEPMTTQRGAHLLEVIARVKPGVTMVQAQADMSRIDANLSSEYRETNAQFGAARLIPELELMTGDVQPALLVLLAAVGLVLLIACANIANLLLARSMERQKEMAVRSALGAPRGRVVAQLLTESVVLSLIGGAVALLLAAWATAGLVRLIPRNVPRMTQVGVDGPVFLFALAVSIVTGILFGIMPALQAARVDPIESLRETGRSLSAGLRHHRLRSALVVVEMTLAVALLAGAGLLLRSFVRLEQVNPGFNPHGLLTFSIDLPDSRYTTEQQVNFFDRLLRRLDALPGVRQAGAIQPLPLGRNRIDVGFTIVGHPSSPERQLDAPFRTISPGYFHLMGIPVLEGREFTAQDTRNSAPVLIVSQAFAKKYFPGQDPVGQRIIPGASDHPVKSVPPYQIVGVVGNVHAVNLGEAPQPEYYVPDSQVMFGGYSILVRTATSPESLAGAVREVVWRMDPDVPVYQMETMDQYMGAAVAQPRFAMLLLSIFAGLALVLTAVGLYGVISYVVAQRTHEIGIRIALGAGPREILGQVLGSGARIALLGILCGIAAALASTRLLRTLLFGVTAGDPATFAAVALLLFAVAMLACYLPALRAMRVDPVVALRQE